MHAYPQRSWAKIYQQMWCMTMKDPIPVKNQLFQNGKKVNFQSGQSGNNQHKQNRNNQNRHNGKKSGKPNYCWVWNKGGCERPKCDYVDRCLYCDANDHSLNRCQKAKDEGKQ